MEVSFSVTADGWALRSATALCGAFLREALVTLPPFPVTCGDLSCGACHIYLPLDLAEGEIGHDESQLLDLADAPRRRGSRLACQVRVNESFRGATIEIATPARRA